MKNKCMLVVILLILSGTAFAKIVLPPIFSDNMVLQQQTNAPIWGEAQPMKTVKVTTSWDGKTYAVQADKAGKWKVTVHTPVAGGPYEIALTDGKKVSLKNVMIGEVWICSGQSNMEMRLIHTSWGGTNVESWISGEVLKEMPEFVKTVESIQKMPNDKKILKAEYLKELTAWNNRVDEGFAEGKPVRAAASLDDKDWESMNFPGEVGPQLAGFDGVMWVRKEIEIPASWAGKDVQLSLGAIDDNDITYWNGIEIGRTDGPTLQRKYIIPEKMVKAGKAILAIRVLDTGGNCGIWGDLYLRSTNDEQISLSGDWKYQVAADTHKVGALPVDRSVDPNLPTSLYNAMIHPLISYGIRGAIWYQGENNSSRAYQYRELFPLVIENWRRDWKQDFPFYFVQLANFMHEVSQPAESEWAELREAQMRALAVGNTGMAVIIDRGDANDIHPKDKQTVGHRLALIARAKTYGEKVPYSGPIYRSHQIVGNKIILSFDHTDGGLKSSDGKELKGFAIAGRNHEFHWAKAEIDGDKIIVSAPEAVPYPVAVRYAWANNPVCNLYNGAGLPASPFRTDDWRGITQKD